MKTMQDAPPSTETSTPQSDNQKHIPALWRRFWARTFDLSWQMTTLGLVFGFLLAKLAPELMVKLFFVVDSRQSLLNPWFYSLIVFVPFALLLDALMLRFFGNTPGKALLGLKVAHCEKARPTLGLYLLRNLGLWVRGLGFSIPIVTLFTMLRQFFQAKEHELTHYDLKTGFRVLAKPLPLWRKLVFVVLMCGVYGLNSLSAPNQPPPRNMAPLYWKNPETGYTAVLPGYWQTEVGPLPTGRNGYAFHGPLTTVFFLPERAADDAPFEDLVFAFIMATANKMELKMGTYSDYKGLPTWRTTGRPLDEPDHLRHVQLIQSGDTLWHVITAQRPPYHPNPAEVEQIQTRLLDTLPRNPPRTYSQKYP